MADNLKQVIVNVNAKDFIVKCSEEFANFLEDDIALISGGTKKIELSYENYILERELKKLIKAINEELPTK